MVNCSKYRSKKNTEQSFTEKDVWRADEDLDLEILQHVKNYIISFEKIEQNWLKLIIKVHSLEQVRLGKSFGELKSQISNFNTFSKFVSLKSDFDYTDIDNILFEEYEFYLYSYKQKNNKNLSRNTIIKKLRTLKSLLVLCKRKGWLNVDTYWFKGKFKNSITPTNDDIEYIPEEVWNQLSENLHYLPEPLQRMVIVIRSMGLRIGELLNLPIDCLYRRGDRWRLRLLTGKYRVEDELPICDELASIVKEQQQYVKHYLETTFHIYLQGMRQKRMANIYLLLE